MRDPAREKAGGRVVALLLVGLLVVFGGGYAAAYVAASEKVARGTTIEGVQVGGLTQEQAVRALQKGLADRAAAPITVSVDGAEHALSPHDAGLSVDYDASVAEAGGTKSWHPTRLWDHYTGGDDLEAVVGVDESALSAVIDRLSEDTGVRARDGRVELRAGDVRVTDPRVGQELDPEAAAAAIEEAFLDDEPAELSLRTVQPEVDEADVRVALTEFANPAVSGPVTLVFDETPIRLHPRDFGDALSMTAEDGALVPDLDERALLRMVGDAVSDGAPVDATVRIVGGRPKVIPARPGVDYDRDDVAGAFLNAVTRTGKREAEVEATVAKPGFTTKDARRLEITEQVSTFTTYYPHAEYRNINIGRAAELIDGTILEPGETFSLNETVGERTRENGFTEGFIIADGVYKEDLGGGVSQIATTTFNAMFFAGLRDIEHKPHSFYIDRYPVGREATVAWGSVDLRFENDTPYGVLIQAEVADSTPASQGAVTVSMWSTDYWDITTRTGERYNYTQPETRTLRTEDCYPNDGYAGFEVDVTRLFRRAGESKLDHRENFHTTYLPSDTVICQPPSG